TEYNLILMLVTNAQRILTREEMWMKLRGFEFKPLDRVLDGHITRLRSKIKRKGAARLIKSVRGVGYVFSGEVSFVEPSATLDVRMKISAQSSYL
ncbi:MAG: winged helix-turn-helix domain-containing protein, partial [Hyphomicrobium sp.]